MDVLGETDSLLNMDVSFQAVDLKGTSSLTEFFNKQQLMDIYEKFIQPQTVRNNSNTSHHLQSIRKEGKPRVPLVSQRTRSTH